MKQKRIFNISSIKVKYSRIIPFPGFLAINLFGNIFVRSEYKGRSLSPSTLRHEYIHTLQQKELLYIGFYLWYFIEWLVKLLFYGKNSYYNISFEREAFSFQSDEFYIGSRKPFSFLKFL